jgi:rod shape-determining protein MreD
MISQIPINFLRFFILLFAQVLIFSNINLSTFVNPYIFPLFLLLLPFETPRWLLVFLGFGAGLALDFFLGSIGMHAAACLALGYFRPNLINLITPKGTDFEISPNLYAQGITWFVIYLSISLFFYLLFYFLIEEAGFRNFFYLLLKVVLSTTISVFFMILFLFLFSSRKQRRFV